MPQAENYDQLKKEILARAEVTKAVRAQKYHAWREKNQYIVNAKVNGNEAKALYSGSAMTLVAPEFVVAKKLDNKSQDRYYLHSWGC